MELLIVFISLLLSFFFSGFETGFISLSYVNVLYLAKIENSKAFKKILILFNKKELVISILLVGNNLALIMGTMAYNAFLYKLLAGCDNLEFLMTIISVFTLTPLFFFFGELLPKSLFKTYPYLMVNNTYFIFKPIYILLFIPGFIFSVFSKTVVNIINSIFNNKATSENILKHTLNAISTNVNPKIIEDIIEEKRVIKSSFIKIKKSMMYPQSAKYEVIAKVKTPVFVYNNSKILGIIPSFNPSITAETKLSLVYNRVSFYNSFDEVDIHNMTKNFFIVKDGKNYYYSSKELILKDLLKI